MVPILILLVVIVGVGVSVVAVRNRAEHGIESGITSFRREMRALAPPSGDRDPNRFARERESEVDDVRASPVEQDPGVHVLDSRPDAPASSRPAAPVGDPFGVDDPAGFPDDDDDDLDGGG